MGTPTVNTVPSPLNSLHKQGWRARGNVAWARQGCVYSWRKDFLSYQISEWIIPDLSETWPELEINLEMGWFFIWALATEPDFKTSQRPIPFIISVPLCVLETEMPRLVGQHGLQWQRHLLSRPAHQSLRPVCREVISLHFSFRICEMGPMKISSEVLRSVFSAETMSAIYVALAFKQKLPHCVPLFPPIIEPA